MRRMRSMGSEDRRRRFPKAATVWPESSELLELPASDGDPVEVRVPDSCADDCSELLKKRLPEALCEPFVCALLLAVEEEWEVFATQPIPVPTAKARRGRRKDLDFIATLYYECSISKFHHKGFKYRRVRPVRGGDYSFF